MNSANDSDLPSLLDVFLATAEHSISGDRFVLKFREEEWTYADLDLISNGMANEIRERDGLHPVVASVSDNHPLALALMLATWKLNGIFAPVDPHAPPEMMSKMLNNIEPTCVFVPQDKAANQLQQVLGPSVRSLSSGNSTLASLMEKFVATGRNQASPTPQSSDIALYVHTSSAAGPWNLKCVPISHGMLSHSSHRKLHYMRQSCSDKFENSKVLGWAPWSHIMGIMSDIGASTLLTSGCYIFATSRNKDEVQTDTIDCLLDVMVRERPDIYQTVPWVMDKFMKKHTQLLQEGRGQEASSLCDSLVLLKALMSGGAVLSNETAVWAQANGISLFSDIGMTETGPLFASRLNLSLSQNPWLPPEPILTDVLVRLVDEEGMEVLKEGELEVSSFYIAEQYIKYDSSSFSKDGDGRNVFKTGDIYKRTESGHLIWQGRKDDFIQMVSSETFDPRPIEAALNRSSSIFRSCIVGNNYLNKPSEHLIAIIQPVTSNPLNLPTVVQSNTKLSITRAVAAVNKILSPSLRISWSRVLVLEEAETIPLTRKCTVFRKKIESMFADKIAALEHAPLSTLKPHATSSIPPLDIPKFQPFFTGAHFKPSHTNPWRVEEVFEEVVRILADVLLVDPKSLRENRECTFAEFGMDSNMATRIANNLNQTFHLALPLNTCHRHIDLEMLHRAIIQALGNIKAGIPEMGHEPAPSTELSSPLPPPTEEVVIVGQALRLPGNIDTPELFWNALLDMREDIMSPVPKDRWEHTSFYRSSTSSAPSRAGDIYFEKAGFMDVANFDHTFFGISAPEAKQMTPATRLTLEVAFEAFENAGIPISSVKGSNMGVWTALSSAQGYSDLLYLEKGYEAFSRFYGLGQAPSAACGRLSYLFDVHGPSLTVDTACSSSMVAFHQAVQYIASGEGESAIVVAANTILWPGSLRYINLLTMTPDRDEHRAILASSLLRRWLLDIHVAQRSPMKQMGKNSVHYVPSEGAGAVILKTRSAALRDNDNILAVVRSTDIKHGGRSQGLVAPNVNVQVALQHSLLQKARLLPQEIDFLEAHGTGTSLGDAIEIEGINEVFQNSHYDNPLVVGSAKSCVGHTEFAAGLVSIIKAIGTLRHQSVPGSVHLREDNFNPSFNLKNVPLLIPIQTTKLHDKPKNVSHHGLIMSNGFAGTIAGTILASSPEIQRSPSGSSSTLTNGPFLFVLSAKSRSALKKYLQLYQAYCQVANSEELPTICYTACTGREHYPHRFAAAVTSLEDLVQQLGSALAKFSYENEIRSNKILFAFPGQGCQYPGMAAVLASAFPAFQTVLLSTANMASERTGLPITTFLMDKTVTPQGPIQDPVTTQVSIFVYQYTLSVYIQTLGIFPSATLGHSLGEISAAVLSGALSLDVGLDLVIARARILRSDPSRPSGMAVVAASMEVIQDTIRRLGLGSKLVIAVYNSPDNHVISGEMAALDLFISRSKYNGLRVSKLKVSEGFHSPSIHSALPELQHWLQSSEYLSTSLLLPLYSTAYGVNIPAGHRLKSTHWIQHAADPVRLSDVINCVNASNELETILDLGPQPFIWAVLQGQINSKLAVSCTTKPSGDQVIAVLQAVGQLFESGSDINFTQLFPSGLRKILLPTYPYQRRRFYPTVIPTRNTPPTTQPSLIDAPVSFKTSIVFCVDAQMFDLLDHHRIESRRVVPAVALAEFFIQLSPYKSLQSITFHAPLVLDNPDQKVQGTVTANGTFSLFGGEDSPNPVKVASGMLTSTSPPEIPRIKAMSTLPSLVLDHQEVYKDVRHVVFGALFRNIQELRFYDGYVEASISVNSTSHTMLDRIQKLDPCLHMLGAINRRWGETLTVGKIAGGYLPTSLEDLTFYTQDLPDSFICRYRLPLSASRDYAVMHTSFEIVSLGGDLLVSCGKYSVAWIPTGLALQKDGSPSSYFPTTTHSPANETWLHQSWFVEQVPGKSGHAITKIDHLYFITPEGNNAKVYSVFAALARRSTILHLPAKGPAETVFSQDLAPHFNSGEATIVLNLTSLNQLPSDSNFAFIHQHVLALLQVLARCRAIIKNFLVISAQSIPALSEPNWSTASLRGPGVAAVIQGMLRVFRRETGLDDAVWSLDLPTMTSLDDTDLNRFITGEMLSKIQGLSKHRSVAYRKDDILGIVRLVPRFRYAIQTPSSTTLGGVCLVVGMGDIGITLAPALLLDGCSTVLYIGRRSKDDITVVNTLNSLQENIRGRCEYVQADVCDFATLSVVIDEIQRTFGHIEHVIHTAVALKDASIQNTDHESFQAVLRPKVIGAWNLHSVTLENCLSLKSFVLLSSISVTLGNEGQLAYVAGNFYMDTLATHRVASGLPAVSLQIGPWSSSKAVKSMQKANKLVLDLDDTEGVSLILKAMKLSMEKEHRRSPVQLIARFNNTKLSASGHLKDDPLFTDLIQDGSRAANTERTIQKPLPVELTSSVTETPKHELRIGTTELSNTRETSTQILKIMGEILELPPSEALEISGSLLSAGFDSISFAQVRGRAVQELNIEIPVKFLGDSFSIRDLLHFVETRYRNDTQVSQ
ncbi:hypothetical protein CPB83DRAFT_898058 [Crepidotus variabilis]|uniref:Uncharacterized protein n=1 Tax=Crepidotus variabilis TaxID=179855 RepID=A0A9P6JKY5_9AGAR|nr:hypothetical protein CPB83DRAFT_898058 [Crepidotus variabilis]